MCVCVIDLCGVDMHRGGDNVSYRHRHSAAARRRRLLSLTGVDDRQHHGVRHQPHHHPHPRQDLPETRTHLHAMGWVRLSVVAAARRGNSNLTQGSLDAAHACISVRLLGPFHGAIAVPSVTRCRCRRCLLYTSPSPRDRQKSRMPSSA